MFLIKNRYYSDYGLDYVFERLTVELKAYNIHLEQINAPIFGYERDGSYVITDKHKLGKAVVFFDKDIKLAYALERSGIKLLPNCANTLRYCDDKELTYSVLSCAGIPIAKTICAPLVFDVNTQTDLQLLDYIENQLGFPLVVKENIGSQGKQVYLAKSRSELESLNSLLRHKPHMYQEFVGEVGCDVRVYVIGGEAVACVKRRNTTDFKSNIAMGGNMERYGLTEELRDFSIRIARLLELNYGSIDFLLGETPLFIEANSNAYFKGIESLGIPIAGHLAQFVVNKLTKA